MVKNNFNWYTWNMALLGSSNDVLIEAGQTKVFLGKMPFRNLINTEFLVFQKKKDNLYNISMKGVFPSISGWSIDDGEDVPLTVGDRTLYQILGLYGNPVYPLDFFEGDMSPFNIPEDFFPDSEDIRFPWISIFLNLPPRKKKIVVDVKLAFLHNIEPVSEEFCASFFGIKSHEQLKDMGINVDLLHKLQVTQKTDKDGRIVNYVHF